MRALWGIAGLLALGATAVWAVPSYNQAFDQSRFATNDSVASAIAAATSTLSSAVLTGTYTIASLPAANANRAKYAFVTDLGGGADMVLSDGANWKHIRQGAPGSLAINSSVTVTPLQTPPLMVLTGNAFATAANINIAANGLYVGYAVTITVPSGVLGVLGTLGVSAAGGTAAPILGGTWADFVYDGTKLVKVRSGTI